MTDNLTAVRAAFALPGEAVFPESIGIDPRTGAGYVGSLADGTLYRLEAPGDVSVFTPAGHDGRRSVAGVKVDGHGRLWAAGGYEGTLDVVALDSGELLMRHEVEQPSCVNDIAFAADGAAYVTDSLIPTLFRVDPVTLELSAFADLAAAGIPWPEGLNLNGIIVAPDGRALVACQTNTGRFWRIALDGAAVSEVALEGGPLEHCDGLAIDGTTLYVAVNAANEIAVVELSPDGASGRVRERLSSPALRFPTALAVTGEQLLIVNAQLDRMGGAPELPFCILAAPRPA